MAKIKLIKPDGTEQPNPATGADVQADQDKDDAEPKNAVRTATVKMRGRAPVTVEYPADAADPFTAAVNAFKESQGIWSLPEQPDVQQHE